MTNGPGGSDFSHRSSRQASTPGCESATAAEQLATSSFTQSTNASATRCDESQLEITDACQRSGQLQEGDSSHRAGTALRPTCDPAATGVDCWRNFSGQLGPAVEEEKGLGACRDLPSADGGSGAGLCDKRWRQGLKEGERQEQQEVNRADEFDNAAASIDGLLSGLREEHWQKLCADGQSLMGGNLSAMGLIINSALRHSWSQLGTTTRKQYSTAFQSHATRLGRTLKGDLLPLPLGMSAEDLAEADDLLRRGRLSSADEQRAVELGIAAWLDAVVLVLNSMWNMPQSTMVKDDMKPDWPGLSNVKPKPNQQRALTLLRDRIVSFVFDADAKPVRTEDADWGETLKKKRYNYSGHLVAKAAPIVWAQVEPGLPMPGVAAKVDVRKLAAGRMLTLLSDPARLLKPRSEWPSSFNNTRVLAASDEDWNSFGMGCLEMKIARIVHSSEMLRDSQ